jgi:hypothetical protein
MSGRLVGFGSPTAVEGRAAVAIKAKKAKQEVVL